MIKNIGRGGAEVDLSQIMLTKEEAPRVYALIEGARKEQENEKEN